MDDDFVSGLLNNPSAYSDIRLSSDVAGASGDLFSGGDFVSGFPGSNGLSFDPSIANSIFSPGVTTGASNNTIQAVPYKSVIDTLGSIINTGLAVYKDVTTIQNAKNNITTASAPTVPSRVIVQAQPQGQGQNLLDSLLSSLNTLGQAPQLINQAQGITKTAQYTGWIIAGALVILAVAIFARSK